MKKFALFILLASLGNTTLTAQTGAARTPDDARAASVTVCELGAHAETSQPARGLGDHLSVDAGWRTFPTSHQAHRFAMMMERRGYCTSVFYDACAGWWVCEFV